MTILVTGGTGYIGSHTVVRLIEAGYEVLVLDNLSNSQKNVIDRIEKITVVRPDFEEADIRDRGTLRQIFGKYDISAVIHFAGLKAVGESAIKPLLYYDNNVSGTLILLEEMARASVKTMVFSSSATVYGDPGNTQYHECMPLKPVNVYGRTKLMVEDVLRDLKQSDDDWAIALLRYFNPVGAHKSGLIGENPNGIPNNLIPFIAQVAQGQREKLYVYGNDYPTPDGTGMRDYIHVDDLAQGHLAALSGLEKSKETITVNLGTGRAYSVLEMLAAFEKACGKRIPYEIVAKRTGDLAEYFADPTLARNVLGWVASKDIDEMCSDTWRWQQNSLKIQ